MLVAQLCEYTVSHWIVYFISVNFMKSELYHNKAVIKNKQTPLCLKKKKNPQTFQ